MDYQGQRHAELIFYWTIIIFGAIGWIIGYIHQDFSYVFYPWLCGVVIATVLCVPDWPMYNKRPLKWLDSVPERTRNRKKQTKKE